MKPAHAMEAGLLAKGSLGLSGSSLQTFQGIGLNRLELRCLPNASLTCVSAKQLPGSLQMADS